MPKQLLIVFVKNIKLGKVKTRLAKSIGDEAALEIYKKLITITEKATNNLIADKHIFYSDFIDDAQWSNTNKFIQKGNDIGERMSNAFKNGFDLGYEHIILIGSDLPDISKSIIQQGFSALNSTPFVFGQAEDGGYYLVGMAKYHSQIFKDKPWSQPNLLTETLLELDKNRQSYTLLKTLNDIDTYEDLKQSFLINEID
jgi:rSAM/selenodomain-associated transferase 1